MTDYTRTTAAVLDTIDAALVRAIQAARSVPYRGIEGLPRYDAATYEHAIQFARDVLRREREIEAEAAVFSREAAIEEKTNEILEAREFR